MSGMNAWLAQVYGTSEAGADDIEKTAQAMMIEKLAEEENFDVSGLTEEQIEQLADEILAEGDEEPAEVQAQGAGEGEAQGEPEEIPELEKKAFEMDFLGRQMAHAMVQELHLIKQAEMSKEAKFGKAVEALRGVGRRARWHGAAAKEKVKELAGKVKGKAKDVAGKASAKVGKGLERVGKGAVRAVGRTGGGEQAMNPRTARRVGAGVVGTGALAAGGAAFGAKKGMSKKASAAVEVLAQRRARELLAEAGIQVDE